MPVSPIALWKEQKRALLSEDDNFYRRMLYFFELFVPDDVNFLGSQLSFLYPLIIPPENYTMDEPFLAEIENTQGGGAYAEENGIVVRPIRLRGHTGFKPRSVQTRFGVGRPAVMDPYKKSFGRELPETIVAALSGQRHFQYLQDSIFRTYADLKRDPATSEGTKLVFHNPRDKEHWVVVPKRFTLERDTSRKLLYQYNIELMAVAPADVTPWEFSEDQSLFDWLKDKLRAVKSGFDTVSGAINDITAVLADIKSFVKNIGTIIDSATAILDAVDNFLTGFTDVIAAPASWINSTVELLEAGAEVASTFEEVPDAIVQKFRYAVKGFERIGAHPELFESSLNSKTHTLRDNQETRRQLTQTEKEEILETETPDSFDGWRNLGTARTPGDVESSEGEVLAGSSVLKYKSTKQVSIQQGDTLISLASKHMGDARQWQYIAELNGLKPPFLDKQASAPLVGAVSDGSQMSGSATGADESPFPETLGIGSKILIPTNQTSPKDSPMLPVLGVGLEESAENHFLGTDAKLEAVGDVFGSSRAQYDIPINTDLGSTDIQVVSGINNLAQAIIVRLLTEKGTDLLYRKLGVQRIVGLGFTSVDLEMAHFRIVEAVKNDPRIASIRNVQLVQEGDGFDKLAVSMEARIRGFSESRAVKAIL